MIVAVLHLFKIHGEVIPGNPSIIVENMLRKTPKSFNAVNVILRASIHQVFGVIHGVMLPQAFERIVARKGIRVVDRPLSRFLSDDLHQFESTHMLHHPRIDPSIALQQAKNDTLPLGTPSALSFASPAKIRLIQFDLSRQSLAFQFRYVVNGFSQLLVGTGHALVINLEIMSQAVGRLLQVEAFQNSQFSFQSLQAFLMQTLVTFHIASPGSRCLKRSTENTLSPSLKVGRTTENIAFSLYHTDILTPYGYETH